MHIEKLIQKLPNQAESFHLYPANPRDAAYRCGSDRKKKITTTKTKEEEPSLEAEGCLH